MTVTPIKPYIIRVAEVIYTKTSNIKKNNSKISTLESIKKFVNTDEFKEISSGKFHDVWFSELEKNNFIDKETNEKIPHETLELLKIQQELITKQLIKFPESSLTKKIYPPEISQQIFDHLWRMCESYELWCKEIGQLDNLTLKIID